MKAVSIGRGGQRRQEQGRDAKWAVDVRVEGGGPSYYPVGVITRFYKTKEAAFEHAAAVNAGTAYKPGSEFYGRAQDAVVVPAWYVDDHDMASPWETPEGMRMMEDAYTEAQVPLPDWLLQLKHRPPGNGEASEGDAPGGNATARVRDRSESAVSAAPVDQDALLESIANIRAYKHHDGKIAPYQFLVLTWAIWRARRREPRLARFDEVKGELFKLLSPFRVAEAEPDPADPWYALRNTPWWELSAPLPSTFDDVRRLNTAAGLRQPVYDLLTADVAFAERTLRMLDERIATTPEEQYALVDLGLSAASAPPDGARADLPSHESVPVENSYTEQFTAAYEAMAFADRTRREAALQRKYQEHLEAQGHTVTRKRINVDGQTLYSDLYDEDTDDLIEVKSLNDRVTMRLALGQILDYAFIAKPAVLTVVVARRPTEGIIRLYQQHSVRVVWPNADGEFEPEGGR